MLLKTGSWYKMSKKYDDGEDVVFVKIKEYDGIQVVHMMDSTIDDYIKWGFTFEPAICFTGAEWNDFLDDLDRLHDENRVPG